MELFHGFYRAKVVDDKDPNKYGRVKLWIPDLMPTVSDSEGIWARPGNNPIGGRNDDGDESHHYMGSCMIPQKGSWVFVFFEAGNINRPYYFGALDIEHKKVLPECQAGTEYQKKWVPIKTRMGRTIVISDDPDDERIEITGKKRQITNPPTGDWESVWQIDGNQTTILFDEREGKEKILIRTYKGDFLHIDIDEQSMYAKFANHIILEAGREILFKAGQSISFRAGERIDGLAGEDINWTSNTGDISTTAKIGQINNKADKSINSQSVSGTIINKAKSAIFTQSTDGMIANKAKLSISDHVTDGTITSKSKSSINMESESGSFNVKTGNKLNLESTGDSNIKSVAKINLESGSDTNIKAGGILAKDGNMNYTQCNMAGSADGAESSISLPDVGDILDADIPLDADPEGYRET